MALLVFTQLQIYKWKVIFKLVHNMQVYANKIGANGIQEGHCGSQATEPCFPYGAGLES